MQLKQSKTELKRKNNKDITNRWQNRKYLIFYLHPSPHVKLREKERRASPWGRYEKEEKYLIYYTRDFSN
jgi:hypothetical protein